MFPPILAQMDPVANGYLTQDAHGNPRLPALRHLGDIDLADQGQATFLWNTNCTVFRMRTSHFPSLR